MIHGLPEVSSNTNILHHSIPELHSCLHQLHVARMLFSAETLGVIVLSVIKRNLNSFIMFSSKLHLYHTKR